MENKETINIIVNSMGTKYMCKDISVFCTANEFLVSFLESINFDSKYECAYRLGLKRNGKTMIVNKSQKISELIDDENDVIELYLIQKILAG